MRSGAEVTVADLRAFPDDTVRSVVGDLCDPSVVEAAVSQGTEAIIHLAAVTRVLLSIEDPAGTHALNVDATAGLLEQARLKGVGSFVLASTNAVTGDVGRATITEQIPLRPLTPYGATKAAGEMLLGAYAACYGMTGCALRFSNVYGPGMAEKDSFVPRLMRAAAGGRGVQVYGDGTQVRDLVHVDDIVAGIFTALRAGFTGPLILGAGESVTVNEIVAAARSVTGTEIPVENVPAKAGEMPAVTAPGTTSSPAWPPSGRSSRRQRNDVHARQRRRHRRRGRPRVHRPLRSQGNQAAAAGHRDRRL